MALGNGTLAASLYVAVGADTRDLEKGLGRADQKVQGFGNQIGGLARAAGGIYAVKTAFDFTIGSAIEWESAFAGVEKTVDASDAELANLEHTLRGMSRTMPVAAEELAGIAEQAGALGIKSQDIAGFTETVAQMAETTNVSADQAATSLGQLSNVLGITEQDYDNFGSALVDLGNKGASTEAQILEIASRAGAGAALIDIATDSTLGWSSAVANLGIEAEAGGSSLQRFFLGAAEHVGMAGEELEAMAKTAGMSAAEFARAFNEDASGALQLFIGGLGEMDQAAQIAMLDLLGFGDVRITRTLLGLAGNTDNLTDSLEISGEAWVENTALVEEYGKRSATTASKIEVLTNRLGDLGRRLGESQGGPVNVAIGLGDASLSGWEKMFLDMELAFDEGASNLAAKMEDKGNFLRNNFLSEGLFGDEVKNQIRDNVIAWGTSVEETIDLMERGLTPALIKQGEAWEAYQKQISGAMDGAGEIVEEGVEGMAIDAGGLPEMMADEMLANQFHLTDATAELVNFMEEAISPAQEMFHAQGFLASQELEDGLNSGIPAVREKAQEMRDAALAVLASGNAGPGGASIIRSWINGMNGAYYSDGVYKIKGLVGNAARIFGQSLPTDGPMAGGVASGGISVAESWIEGLVSGVGAGMGSVEDAIGAVGALMSPNLGPDIAFGFSGSGGAAGGMDAGAGNTTNIYLTVEGEKPVVSTAQDIVREAARLGRLANA